MYLPPPPGLICASWQCEGLSFTLGKFAISRQFHTQFTCDWFHGKKKSLTEFCPLFYIFHKNTNSSFSPLHVFYTPHSGTTHQKGSFSNDDGDSNQDVKKAIGLLRKTTSLHVITLFCTFLHRPCTTTT